MDIFWSSGVDLIVEVVVAVVLSAGELCVGDVIAIGVVEVFCFGVVGRVFIVVVVVVIVVVEDLIGKGQTPLLHLPL